ncbi:MAG: PepSY-associated TM helix domain-containing protein [Acetobacteraceae bacterium]
MVLPVLRRIHRWLGLLLALPLLVQGVSGLILTVEPLLPDFDAIAASSGEPSAAGAIVAAAQADAPPGLRPARYVPPAEPGGAATVYFIAASGPRGPGLGIVVDPVSLTVLDRQPGGNSVFDWIKSLHTNLLVEGRSGRSIIGWFGVGLIALALIGIPLWWPPPQRWRAAFMVDPRARGHLLHRRLHGAAGIWSLLLLLATACTGVVMAFPQTARGALGLPEGAPRPGRAGGPRADLSAADIDRAAALVRSAVPGLRLRVLLLPASRNEPVRALLLPPGQEGASSTVAVAVDAAAGRVLSVQDPRAMPVAELTLRWAHDLHFGQGFGPLWRGLTILTGLVLPVFSITGVAMWLYRRRRRRAPVLQPGE